MFLATTHLGSVNVNFQMEQCVYMCRADGHEPSKAWERLVFAVIEYPQDVFVISSNSIGQFAVLKLAKYTGLTLVAGRFTPEAFTNQIQPAFREPRLLVVTDTNTDQLPIIEASYANISFIVFCNTDSSLHYFSILIPCNNKFPHSAGLMWWLMSREVFRLRSISSRVSQLPVFIDLYFYNVPEEAEMEKLLRRNCCPNLK
ncbi:unnamed protein product [Ceratitis capitata]|uniref:40S ribosomal protein SA n=1 Tax=Ceratitis capitata TaxID=7213 RepID=A0A811V524_CERCA|nr:unnamed protein product [Ceratitis capitata]